MGWPLVGLARAAFAVLSRFPVTDPGAVRTVTGAIRQVFLSGASVTAPFVVTIVVLGIIFDFVANVLAPFASALSLLGLTIGQNEVFAQGLTLAVMLGVVFLAGVVVETGPTMGVRQGLNRVVSAVPGVGPMYSSFDRMSAVMLDGDARSFREVKLVEFPRAGIYSLAFQTSAVHDATAVDENGERLLVLFVPLAPNPVMGGFMICVPARHVRDVDITVQEAFQAIVTSGVAMTDSLRT